MNDNYDNGTKVYTPKEVAEMLRLSNSTVKRYCKEGLLPHMKVGPHIRIKAEYIDKLFK